MATGVNDDILTDLEKMLSSAFNLPYSLAKSEKNPKVGSFIFKKPVVYANWLPDKVKTFYKKRGFELKEIIPKIMVANHQETHEQYDLYFHDLGRNYALVVSESILNF